MRNRDLDSHAPYNAFSIDEEGCLDNSSYEIDFWSVGIVIFEIIAGTELVIPAVTATEVEVLLQMCEPHMDEETVQLLQHLLFDAHEGYLDKYLSEVLPEQPNVIAENVRALYAATKEDSHLSSQLFEFKDKWFKDNA